MAGRPISFEAHLHVTVFFVINIWHGLVRQVNITYFLNVQFLSQVESSLRG